MRKLVTAGLVACSLAFGAGGAIAAQASTATLSTTSRVETLISAKCYYEHQVTRSWFHYSKAAGRYVAYPAVKTTTTTSTHCHA